MNDDFLLPYKVDKQMEYLSWAGKIPYISFPDDWEVRIIPPFSGAIVRFLARLKGKEKSISVYLDCYQKLGCMDAPYWEAYKIGDDTIRFYLDETNELIKAIDEELRK